MVPWPLLALVPQPSSSFLFSSYPCSLALVRTYLLALPLLAVAVDGGGGEVLEGQEALERVGLGLGLDEDEGEARVLVEELQETGVLVVLLDVLDLTGGVRTGRRACQHPPARGSNARFAGRAYHLGNVLRRRADTADGQEHVVVQELRGETLHLLGERRAEHERLALLRQVCVCARA